ncbi:MAG: hypothetical protein H6R43_388 [Nitrospirae bacterium]|nr:hypothetical protein [Nitrospirota bacterium]
MSAPIIKEKAAADNRQSMTMAMMKALAARVGLADLPVTLCRMNNARKLPKRNTGSRP